MLKKQKLQFYLDFLSCCLDVWEKDYRWMKWDTGTLKLWCGWKGDVFLNERNADYYVLKKMKVKDFACILRFTVFLFVTCSGCKLALALLFNVTPITKCLNAAHTHTQMEEERITIMWFSHITLELLASHCSMSNVTYYVVKADS